MPSDRRRSRGLTLIEGLITVAVLALLATLALPSFASLLTRHRLSAAAEGLVMDMAEARFHAAQSGQSAYVVFRAGADWCYAVARTSHCDCRSAQPCQLKTVRAAHLPGIELARADDAAFDPASAAAVGGRAAWRPTHGPEQLLVSLSGLGRPRICTPSGVPGYSAC